jgi:hypothetical protein
MANKPHAFDEHPLRKQWVAAAIGLLLALGLHSVDLRAALLFRSVEQVNGEQRWSPVRNYGNPSDTAYARVSASGASAPAEEVRVFLSGAVTPADVDSAAIMERLLKDGKQKIAGNSVWLASDGGDIDAGMALGRLLRKLGLFTIIGKNDQCLSACVFAFMGGERRSVAGRLGIHRPYFPFTDGGPDRPERFRHLQHILRDFIEEMDFPDSLYEAVMLVPPESMQIVTPSDLKRFYFEGISPSSEDMADAASARRLNLSMVEFLTRKAKAPACAFLDVGPGLCEGKVQEAAAGGGVADDPRSMRTGAASAGRAESAPTGLPIRLRRPREVDSRGPT